MRDYPIVVFGATGFTGRLTCIELQRSEAASPGTPDVRTDTRFAIAGRQRDKLLALQEELARTGPAPDVIVADVDDAASLARMAASAQVLLDCVGPFSVYGPRVQDAALAAGTHFLDISGEYSYMLATYRRHAEAERRGVVLVNGVGFDVIPTDAAAALSAEALREGTGRAPRRVRIAFSMQAARLSRGTMRSMLRQASTGGLGGASYQGGLWVEEPVAKEIWDAPLPAPAGVQACVSVPWGDVATAPRTTAAGDVRVFVAVPRRAAELLRHAAPLLRLSSLPVVRDLLERGIDLLPEGPRPDERARSGGAVYAEAEGEGGRRAGVWVRTGDGYAFTAASAALCARLCARPGFDRRGALTPSQAFGARALLDGLRDADTAWGHAPAAD